MQTALEYKRKAVIDSLKSVLKTKKKIEEEPQVQE
jgi:hypothetical protein